MDLSQLNGLIVNQTAGTLTVGPGVRIGDILDPVYNAGFEIRESVWFPSQLGLDLISDVETGSCSCPSLIGATIGAGIGRWSGVYGLLIDALLSVRLVTANGRVLHVDGHSNPDLFWGIRGAGANFGIITEATYQLQKVQTGNGTGQGHVMNVDLLIPAEQNLTYFKILESFSGIMPANLAVVSIVNYNETAEAVS